MSTVFNVIYRDPSFTTMFRHSARRTRAQADRLAMSLMGRGWEVLVDDQQPASGAELNKPIVDVRNESFLEVRI
jgi:hypothetical protein